jgi:hypothetical protein
MARQAILASRLLRRAEDGAERAEHAAVAVLRAQVRAAFSAVIKKLAGIDGHCFALREAAMRTRDDRMKKDVVHYASENAPPCGKTDLGRRTPYSLTGRRVLLGIIASGAKQPMVT